MSISATSVPPWKQTLLDKKRRHEEETRRLENQEVHKFSSLPNWKRDLLLKRQGQKNSLVFVGRKQSTGESPERKDSNHDSGTIDQTMGCADQDTENNICNYDMVEPHESDLLPEITQNYNQSSIQQNGESEEHLLPVKENPWLKADPSKKKRYSDTAALYRSNLNENDIGNHHSWSGEIDVLKDTQSVSDDVFDEEVTYGKGFVHKLLRKFSHLSSHQERGRRSSRNSSNRRSHSAENLLDDRSHSSTTPREFSPSGSYSASDSLSPRSPSRSRSTESISAPRPHNDHSTQSANKIGVVDKSSDNTSAYSPRDKVEHSPCRNSSDASSLLSASGDNISEPGGELPKKNIVSSTRNVFENIVPPKVVSEKPAPLTPKPVRSPRNSVHSLIAVDNVEGSSETLWTPSSPSVSSTVNPPSFDTNKDRRNTSESSVFKPITESSRGSSVAEKDNISTVVKNTQPEDIVKSVSCKEAITDVSAESKSVRHDNKNSTTAPSYFELYCNRSHSVDNTTVSSNRSLVNGDVSVNDQTAESNTEVVTSPTAASYKKRKAPLPPKPTNIPDKRHSTVVTNSLSDNSVTNSSIKINGVVESESDLDTKETNSKYVAPVVSQTKLNVAPVVSHTKLSNTKPVAPVPQPRQISTLNTSNSASDAKRPNLSLNLNEINSKKPEVVKCSTGSRNDAYSVINNSKNKKAKIVTPKSSSGPGSLLIRPASNMIHSKNAQFAKLEFTYDDIRTGQFAAPKKKPSHYDDDTDSDEDIPVTNIDDVIDGHMTNGDRTSKDRNSNISKKSGKYEFIGAGVISGKSSLSKRRKAQKINIQFDEHNCTTYEYPSEQSLMSELTPRPGDYDYVDATKVTNGLADDDTDDEETMTIDVEQVSSLKKNPAVGATGPLSGYQSKMQFEYHFGMNMADETVQSEDKKVVQQEMVENEYIKPADEEETANWSETQSADMLF